MQRILPVVLASVVFAACSASLEDPPGPGGKADGDGTCADKLYGDGTCQIDLPCGIPDIDCFVPFATDAEAATWAVARYPATVIPETDPVFAKARTLLDRAWELLRAELPLGKLAELRVAAVLLENPQLNAFVMADGAPGKVGLSVQMYRGLFTHGLTDDEIVGVLLHELAHIVKLHALDEVWKRERRYYIATSPEQLGATAPEVERAKQAGETWRAAAGLVGIVSSPALDAVPLDGNLGTLWSNFSGGPCATAVSTLRSATASIADDRLIGGYVLPPDLETRVAPALSSVRTCSSSEPTTLRLKLAQLGAAWYDYLIARLAADEMALLDRPYLEATLTLTGKRRAELRAIETAFTAATGAPWSALRFFSIEEEADDYAARIATLQGLPADASTGFALVSLGDQRAACEAAIEAGTVPYGMRLTDDHHGDCWRVMHGRQVAAAVESSPESSTARVAPAVPWTPTRPQTPRPVY